MPARTSPSGFSVFSVSYNFNFTVSFSDMKKRFFFFFFTHKMRCYRFMVILLFMLSIILIFIYVILASLARGREAFDSTQKQLLEYKESARMDKETVNRLIENIKGLSMRLTNIDIQNNQSQKHILDSLSKRFDAHQKMLDVLHDNGVISKTHTESEIEKNKKNLENEEKNAKSHANYSAIALCDDLRPGAKMVLSYSLFGDKSEELSRFIRDVHNESLEIHPYKMFTLRVYHDWNLSEETRVRIAGECPRVRFCDIRRNPHYGDLSAHIGTVWRFLPLADRTLDVFCSRDLDSPLLQRGGDAVDEWLASDKLMHVMRDRKVHSIPIMGGMWCFRPGKSSPLGKYLLERILAQSDQNLNGDITTRDDQTLLGSIVWPRIKTRVLQHDSYSCSMYPGAKPFPTERRQHFVGCVRNCDVYGKEICPKECRPKKYPEWTYC